MKIMNRKHQTFCVDTNQELRNALDTWDLVEEDVLGACVPYFIQEKAAEDLFTYTDVFQKAILSSLLPSQYNAAMCRFFIRVIQYRRDAEHYLKEYIINVLCEHLKVEYMKGQYYSYAMTKKVIVWLSILHLEAVVGELRYNIVYEDFNAAIVDTLTEVTSLCATVIMPHILDILPVLGQVVKNAPDQLSKETLCYAIRRLCGSIQEYIVKGGSCKVQLMKAISNMKANISTWLPDVHAELQDSTQVALEFFTVPESSENQPTEPVNDELQTLPHAELLEKYREQVAAENKELEDTEKQRIGMNMLVTSLVSGRKITKDFLQFLLNALKNADPKAKMTAAMFFNEALKHPRLIKQKYQESFRSTIQRFVDMKIMNRKHQTFCVDTNQELRNALDTWNLVEEDVLGACVPYFIQEKVAEDLFTYTDVFQKAILSSLLPSQYNAAMCRFFIRVIQYRRDAAHYLKEYIINVLCEHLKVEYMKGQYYSYAMTKKVIVWLSILHLEAVVGEMRYNIVYEDFNAAIVDTLTEVTSLCATVIMPHILDMLPVLGQVVKNAPDQLSKETLCYAIRRLCGSIQEYIVKGGSCKVQLMKAISNMKANISTWLPDVYAELQDSTKVALEFFTVPESSESQPTKPVNDELQTLPHAELLEKYREQVAADNKELEDTEKQRIGMNMLVTSLVSGRKITKDFLQFLLNALKNADPKAKMTAAMFFNEALKHPRLIKQKYQECAIQHLLKIIEEDDNILCSIAMEALGNATTGATRLVESYKNKIIAHMEFRLSKTSSIKIIMAALRALSSIIRRLKLSVLRRQFIKISREHMDYPDGEVQIAAINLLRDLTESCRLPLFGYFTDKK
ncbi:uncharacterized protein LOC142699163 [Rhinoderma darwinii]|uniref:uncharacterized protein LOC142699163 n=1 Tax=Rhinoderma darwinii TaxID=43563 RepID=UPI003F662195